MLCWDGKCLFCGLVAVSWRNYENSVPGSEDNQQLERDLVSLFVLTRLVQCSEERVSELMKVTDGYPMGKWFGFCGACAVVLKEALQVHQEILRLMGKMKELQNQVRKKIEESAVDGLPEANAGIVNVRLEIRKEIIGGNVK